MARCCNSIIFPLVFLVVISPNLLAQNFTRITLFDDNGWSEGGNWIDYDNDNDLDLFIPNNRRSPNTNFLYENNGDGTFSKLTSGILVTDIVMSESGTWGDYDNDGDIDLFVGDGGFDLPRFNSLYRNEGGGNFTEITEGPIPTELSFSTSSAWADYDNDGYLDLYCANLSPANNPGQSTSFDFLYHNNGDGRFTKITSGVPATIRTRSFGIGWADYDNDGDVDLFVCNSANRNLLYRNEGDGTFQLMSAAQVGSIASDGFSLACSWGDYNNDGYQDLFAGNFGADDFLYRNNGNGTFTKITSGPVVTNSAERAEGSGWADFDNDGDLDLLVANGGAFVGVNYLYRNNGDGTFTSLTSNPIVAQTGCYAGACWGDYDDDGDADLFISNFNGKTSYIYRNDTSGNNWINIRCIGTVSNASAIGAKVWVFAKPDPAAGGYWQLREISGQNGYNSQNSLRAAFGLGTATIVDSLRIEWPSGLSITMTDVAINQFMTIAETIPNGFLRANFSADKIEELHDDSLVVRFSDLSLSDPNSPITTWEWDFDNDGTIDATEQHPVWTYRGNDLYSVRLTVSNGANSLSKVRENYIRVDGVVGIEDSPGTLPAEFILRQNYPNPFNPSTTIEYELSKTSTVVLKIYNSLGKTIKTLVNFVQAPGSKSVVWDGRDDGGNLVSSGVYLYKIIVKNDAQTKKLLLLR